MNILTTKPTRLFAAMTAVIIMAFAMVMTVSAQARPERPTDLTATAIDHNTVSLTWSHPNPANVDHYQVLSRRADSGTGTTQVGTSTTTSFLHDGLEPESTYIYRVRPVNSQGEEGQRSARSEATTPADETPAPEPEPTPAPPQRSDDEGQDNTARSSHDVLVSNIGKLSASESALSLFDHAQGFATGANISGYTLTSIEVKFDSAADTPPTTVALHTSVAPLDTTIASLTGPTTIVAGNNTFTAPSGTILDANTTYYIVIEGGNATVSATSTDSDDSSSLSDWDVLSDGHYRAAASTGNFAVSSHSKQVRVNGAVSTSTTSTDATLSALVLQDASDNSVLTLDPTFDAATLEYTATVADGVDEITIIPTLNDTGASYEIQDGDGTALTDADTSQDDFQVSVSRGLSTIHIEVTAEDDLTTQTYTVTMDRPQVLVSNINKSTFTSQNVGNSGGTQTKIAQKFTTGDNAEGYTVDSVSIDLNRAGNNATPVLTINTSGGDNPGTVIYTLINPGTINSGQIAFAAPTGATLDAETAYFIVIANSNTTDSNSARYEVDNTDSNAEDNSTLPNWSIANVGRINSGVWVPTTGDGANKIQVRGRISVDAAIAASDATLSALVLQDASDNSVLTLDPTFDSATLEYGATVGRDVDEITIIPTPNDTDADYEIQDGDGTALTDADTTQDEFQVSIAAGLNTIQVEVTAEDDATNQTYAVTVTRPRILVSSTGQTSGGSAITGNNAGSQHRHAQKFTTGSNPAGYTLDEVRIHLGSNGNDAAPVITVNSGSGNNPGAVLYTMTNPATITDGATNTFTAPSGATLEADTSYFVVMENSNTNDDPNALYQVGVTASNGEDSTGLSDWDIDDAGRTGTPGWSATSGDVAFRIQVRGTVDVDPNAATLPELSFQSNNITVNEDDSQATVSVLLSQASTDTVTVDYATSDNTAEAGDDYTETSGTLTFAAGETSKTVTITLLNDGVYEDSERFSFTLNNPTGTTLPTFPSARVNILDDESPPTASIANVTVGEGAGTMTLTLNLSHESSRSTSYETTTSDVGGTATAGSDYVSFLLIGGNARITVPTGYTQVNFNITITDDTAAESSETITIHWEHDPTGVNGDATPATIDFTGTITDNDTVVSSDATLSALVVRDDAQKRTLTPGFTPGTYAYATH